MFSLGNQRHQGLSADSAKLVMECIHSSGVKRIGITFLTAVNINPDESNTDGMMYSSYPSLDEYVIEREQTKLARMIVTFLELLHLLVARNRDVLLACVQARKRKPMGDASSVASGSVHGGYAATPRAGMHSFSTPRRHTERNGSDSLGGYGMYERSSSELAGRSTIGENHAARHESDRTDSAIGVQSELQRGLISLVKSLSPYLLDTLNNEVPRWMRSACQDSYFSTGAYRNADIRECDIQCIFIRISTFRHCLNLTLRICLQTTTQPLEKNFSSTWTPVVMTKGETKARHRTQYPDQSFVALAILTERAARVVVFAAIDQESNVHYQSHQNVHQQITEATNTGGPFPVHLMLH